MNRLLVTVWIATAVCVFAFDARAAIIRVEKDGSGDYAIIQDALDAAAPGDTVLVGPGRFDTFRLRTATTNGFQFQSIAHLTTANLTLIGAGDSLTVIGPTIYQEMIGGKVTVGITTDSGESPTRVSGFHFENLYAPMILRSSNASIQQCTFDNRGKALGDWALRVNRGTDSSIRNCSFAGPDGIITAAGGVERLLIEDCQFDNGTLRGQAIVIGNGAINCTVRRCDFTRGGGGGRVWVIEFWMGRGLYIHRCQGRCCKHVLRRGHRTPVHDHARNEAFYQCWQRLPRNLRQRHRRGAAGDHLWLR